MQITLQFFWGKRGGFIITSEERYQSDIGRRTFLKTATAATATGLLAGCSDRESKTENLENSTERVHNETLAQYTGEDLLDDYLGEDLVDRSDVLYESTLNNELRDQEEIINYIEDEVEDTAIYEENGQFIVEGSEQDITGAIEKLREQNSSVLRDLEQLDSWYQTEFEAETSEQSGNMSAGTNSTQNRGLGAIAENELDNQTSYNQSTQRSENKLLDTQNSSFERIVDIYATARELDRTTEQRDVSTEYDHSINLTELETVEPDSEFNITSVDEDNTTFNISGSENNTHIVFNESVSDGRAEEVIEEELTALNRSKRSYTETLLSNLGEFDTIEQAYAVGEEYDTRNRDVDEGGMLQSYLDNEITDVETEFLAEKIKQEDSVLPEDPVSNDWSGDGTENILYMNLGINPVEGNELIAELNEHTYSDISADSEQVRFTRNSNITGENYTFEITKQTFDGLLDNELSLVAEEYGVEEKSDWEKGSEIVESRDEALRELAHFNLSHKEVAPEISLELTRDITEGNDPERRSITWSPRKIENLAAINNFTDLYLENQASQVSAGFYEALKDNDLDEEVIRNITEDIKEEKEIPRGYGDDPEDADRVIRRNTPRSSSGDDDSNDDGGDDPDFGGGVG